MLIPQKTHPPVIYTPFTRSGYLQWNNSPATVFYMTADSIVIQHRLNVNLGAHCLLCTPEEFTHHVCTTLHKKQSELWLCWLHETELRRALLVSSGEHVLIRDTACLMAVHKNVSHCSFIDTSQESESSHTAVKGSQMNTEAWLSHCDRAALGAAAATLRWTKIQYDGQTKLQPEWTDIKWKLIWGSSAKHSELQLTLENHLRF